MIMQTVSLSSLEPGRGRQPAQSAMDRIASKGWRPASGMTACCRTLSSGRSKAKGQHYCIVSGERRYRALKFLEQRGELDGNYAVPVEIRTSLFHGRLLGEFTQNYGIM